jgi:hypothetical protein
VTKGNDHTFMKYHIGSEQEIEQLLQPETRLEHQLLQDARFREGLMWGHPRMGHPEGTVALHVREVLDNIDQLILEEPLRTHLRLIAYSHDTFKYMEDRSFPRNWSRHHAVLARQYMEDYLDHPSVLKVIELHDEAFYSWRQIHLFKSPIEGQRRYEQLLEKLGDDLQLFYLFFKCDTETGDKILEPLHWFEEVTEVVVPASNND